MRTFDVRCLRPVTFSLPLWESFDQFTHPDGDLSEDAVRLLEAVYAEMSKSFGTMGRMWGYVRRPERGHVVEIRTGHDEFFKPGSAHPEIGYISWLDFIKEWGDWIATIWLNENDAAPVSFYLSDFADDGAKAELKLRRLLEPQS